MGTLRYIAVSLAALAMFGCPHEDDPDSPRLVGKYEAINPKRLILGSKSLVIIDAHHLRTDRGKVYRYSTGDEWFCLDAEGYGALFYSTGYYGYPEEILFQWPEKVADASQNIFYKRVR